MNLIALEACFLRYESHVEIYRVAVDPVNYPLGGSREITGPRDYFKPCLFAAAHGLSFLCPKDFIKNNGRVGTHHVIVWFADLSGLVPAHIGLNKEGQPVRWAKSGTDLYDLTLRPSIQEQNDLCGWHGFVTNGDAT